VGWRKAEATATTPVRGLRHEEEGAPPGLNLRNPRIVLATLVSNILNAR
jgi:hypothetical protein